MWLPDSPLNFTDRLRFHFETFAKGGKSVARYDAVTRGKAFAINKMNLDVTLMLHPQ